MKRRIRTAPPATAPASRAVHFELTAPDAKQVFIAGSFNEWRNTDLPMIRLPDGKWAKDLTLPPGRYEYLFVVGDAWTPDPAAKESAANPHGGVNSVVIAPGTA